MNRPARALVFVALAAVTSGCNTHDELAARYNLERKLWSAQRYERQVNIQYVRASSRDLNLAIRAFQTVVASNPLASPRAPGWDPDVVADIEEIVIVSKIALADLYFLAEEYEEAGVTYSSTLREADLALERALDLRLGMLTASYLSGEEKAVERQSATIFREITGSEAFWAGEYELRDVFLNIPLVLVQIYAELGDTVRQREQTRQAFAFYTRVQDTWPESRMAVDAAFAEIRLLMMAENWSAALAVIDRVTPVAGTAATDLLIMKGEILGFALDRASDAREALDAAARTDDRDLRDVARLDIALLHLKSGRESEGLSMLREIESDRATEAEIAARALFARAMYLERAGRWEEALPMLRRIDRLYPGTSPALEAPLAITRHFLARGETELAAQSLEHATDYYVSLIRRGSAYRGDRILVEDFLIEGYLLLDRPAEAAELLLAESSSWDDASTAGAMLKSALLYAHLLGDAARAREILEKCIVLFPDSRYAKIAQQRIDDINDRS